MSIFGKQENINTKESTKEESRKNSAERKKKSSEEYKKDIKSKQELGDKKVVKRNSDRIVNALFSKVSFDQFPAATRGFFGSLSNFITGANKWNKDDERENQFHSKTEIQKNKEAELKRKLDARGYRLKKEDVQIVNYQNIDYDREKAASIYWKEKESQPEYIPYSPAYSETHREIPMQLVELSTQNIKPNSVHNYFNNLIKHIGKGKKETIRYGNIEISQNGDSISFVKKTEAGLSKKFKDYNQPSKIEVSNNIENVEESLSAYKEIKKLLETEQNIYPTLPKEEDIQDAYKAYSNKYKIDYSRDTKKVDYSDLSAAEIDKVIEEQEALKEQEIKEGELLMIDEKYIERKERVTKEFTLEESDSIEDIQNKLKNVIKETAEYSKKQQISQNLIDLYLKKYPDIWGDATSDKDTYNEKDIDHDLSKKFNAAKRINELSQYTLNEARTSFYHQLIDRINTEVDFTDSVTNSNGNDMGYQEYYRKQLKDSHIASIQNNIIPILKSQGFDILSNPEENLHIVLNYPDGVDPKPNYSNETYNGYRDALDNRESFERSVKMLELLNTNGINSSDFRERQKLIQSIVAYLNNALNSRTGKKFIEDPQDDADIQQLQNTLKSKYSKDHLRDNGIHINSKTRERKGMESVEKFSIEYIPPKDLQVDRSSDLVNTDNRSTDLEQEYSDTSSLKEKDFKLPDFYSGEGGIIEMVKTRLESTSNTIIPILGLEKTIEQLQIELENLDATDSKTRETIQDEIILYENEKASQINLINEFDEFLKDIAKTLVEDTKVKTLNPEEITSIQSDLLPLLKSLGYEFSFNPSLKTYTMTQQPEASLLEIISQKFHDNYSQKDEESIDLEVDNPLLNPSTSSEYFKNENPRDEIIEAQVINEDVITEQTIDKENNIKANETVTAGATDKEISEGEHGLENINIPLDKEQTEKLKADYETILNLGYLDRDSVQKVQDILKYDVAGLQVDTVDSPFDNYIQQRNGEFAQVSHSEYMQNKSAAKIEIPRGDFVSEEAAQIVALVLNKLNNETTTPFDVYPNYNDNSFKVSQEHAFQFIDLESKNSPEVPQDDFFVENINDLDLDKLREESIRIDGFGYGNPEPTIIEKTVNASEESPQNTDETETESKKETPSLVYPDLRKPSREEFAAAAQKLEQDLEGVENYASLAERARFQFIQQSLDQLVNPFVTFNGKTDYLVFKEGRGFAPKTLESFNDSQETKIAIPRSRIQSKEAAQYVATLYNSIPHSWTTENEQHFVIDMPDGTYNIQKLNKNAAPKPTIETRAQVLDDSNENSFTEAA